MGGWTSRIGAALAAGALGLAVAGGAAAEPPPGLTAMSGDPCAQSAPAPAAAAVRALLEPGARFTPPSPQAMAAAGQAMAAQRERDWADLCRYRDANAALASPPRVVFMGDSITEFWAVAEPDAFTGKVVDRGVSGQTSPQMLLRFEADVIALKPRLVHIMAGTNDVAGNTGPTTEADFENNIRAMVELARLHGVRVALASIPPTAFIGWKPDYRPAGEIRRLNAWLRSYAADNGLIYVDYYTALATPEGAFRPELSNDGVHPNRRGYAIMRRLAAAAGALE